MGRTRRAELVHGRGSARRDALGRIALVRAAIALAAVAACVVMGCGGDPRPPDGTITLVLGAYTTPREAYGKEIIPAFRRYWKQKTGQDVEFQESYQGSGAQARAIVGGFEADIAALSLEADIDTIADAGLISHDWKGAPNRGIVSRSIVVLAVRQGNPLGVRDWEDLARPGLKILTPDPRTSGGARWNVLAIYGAALRGYAGTPKYDFRAAEDFLKRVFGNVSVMDKGARESITTFGQGVGDVAITYENEVLVGRQAGQTYEYVVPRSTILIENPVAVVDENADKHGVRDAAEAFVEFLASDEAQRALIRYGLRPVNEELAEATEAQFPQVEDLWTIGYFNGWRRVSDEIYGTDGVYTRMFEELHRSE
jgi:sulfate/thiosulfate transport system substrate-binding protein